MLFYLSGSIEYSPDWGKVWRQELAPFLQSCGHQVYDPAMDEKKDLTAQEIENFRRWKTSDLERFQATMRKIINYDLDWIERKCDAVICLWDEYARQGAGTQGELTAAHRRGIPVFLVVAMPVEQVSGWILGCASHVFSDFAQLHDFFAKESAVTLKKPVIFSNTGERPAP